MMATNLRSSLKGRSEGREWTAEFQPRSLLVKAIEQQTVADVHPGGRRSHSHWIGQTAMLDFRFTHFVPVK